MCDRHQALLDKLEYVRKPLFEKQFRNILVGEFAQVVCMNPEDEKTPFALDARGTARHPDNRMDVGIVKYSDANIYSSTWSTYNRPVRFGPLKYLEPMWLKSLAADPQHFIDMKGESESGNPYDASTSLDDRSSSGCMLLESAVDPDRDDAVKFAEPFYFKKVEEDDVFYLEARGEARTQGLQYDVSFTRTKDGEKGSTIWYFLCP